ncbi:MAG: hypothetical protein ABI430_01185 [Candidatus Taylorbacteria bacterium]
MRKRIIIFLAILLTISLVIIILFRLSFIHNGRDWFADQSKEYIANCNDVKIGASFDEIANIMGKPDRNFTENGETKLLYFTGGIKTELGISFELIDNALVKKNCMAD